MTDERKSELVDFIVLAIKELEDYDLTENEVDGIYAMSDDEIMEKADWYDYLLGK